MGGSKQDFDFEKLCNANKNILKRFVLRLTNGDKSLGDDIIQETYLHAVENKETLLPHPNPKAWFYRNAGIFYKRKMSKDNTIRNNETSLENMLDNALSDKEDAAESKDILDLSYEEFESDSDESNMADILIKLSEKERELISLHYEQGYTLQEIASLRKVSYVTVRRCHSEALKALNKLLAEKSINKIKV